VYIYIYMCVCIYIYIYREREREEHIGGRVFPLDPMAQPHWLPPSHLTPPPLLASGDKVRGDRRGGEREGWGGKEPSMAEGKEEGLAIAEGGRVWRGGGVGVGAKRIGLRGP
jgi:hypothetical protein